MSLQPVSFRKGREHAPRLSAPYVPGKHSSRFWTAEEDEIVRAHYPQGGIAACGPRLPERSFRSIYLRAGHLGLSAGKAQRIPTTPEIDAAIRREYPLLSGRGAMEALADRLGRPRWWVTKRATVLGLTTTHKKQPPWTAAEDALMRRVPLHSPDRCADIFREHGFQRSPTAIIVRAKRLDLSRRATRETLSATAASNILGMDAKVVSGWCIAGELKASRRASRRLPQQGGDAWDVQPADLRRYVIDNLDRIDIRKVDKMSFVHLLVGDGMFGKTP